MQLVKAIVVSEPLTRYPYFHPESEQAAAINLGIEAIKRLQENRIDPEFDHYILLPGETEPT